MPADLSTINIKDHSAYIDIAKAHPSTVIKKSVFSIAAYRQVLRLKGSDTSKFDREVGAVVISVKTYQLRCQDDTFFE